jgi:membrane protein insertase Oxa1/YidC/SpoIIIJ
MIQVAGDETFVLVPILAAVVRLLQARAQSLNRGCIEP